MKEYQEALDYLTKLERADNFIRTGDVVPHPASDLLQNLLNYFKNNKLDLHDDLDKYLVALQNLGSIEVYPDENIYVSDYEEFDILKNLLISQKQSTFKECVEKWKNKNFIVNDRLEQYQYITISSKNFDMEDIFIYISFIDNIFKYSLEGHLDRELSELLLETIKTLEVENG